MTQWRWEQRDETAFTHPAHREQAGSTHGVGPAQCPAGRRGHGAVPWADRSWERAQGTERAGRAERAMWAERAQRAQRAERAVGADTSRSNCWELGWLGRKEQRVWLWYGSVCVCVCRMEIIRKQE